MTRTLQIEMFRPDSAEGMSAFRTLERPAPYGPAVLPQEDAHLLVARRGDVPAARLSYRVAHGLHGAPELTGVIGHYEANDDDAGVALLEDAVSRLAAEDAALVIGPMDRTTWGRYRLALPTPAAADPPPFLTEPVNPPEYPQQFEAAGFAPVAHYVSRIVTDLDALTDRTREAEEGMTAAGYRIEPMNAGRFGGTLDAIYDLSLSRVRREPVLLTDPSARVPDHVRSGPFLPGPRAGTPGPRRRRCAAGIRLRVPGPARGRRWGADPRGGQIAGGGPRGQELRHRIAPRS
jgi:hypothetical protein